MRAYPDNHPYEATLYTFTASMSDTDSPEPGHIDAAAVASARAQPGVLSLWRAWRHPTNGSPWPPPRRVYLVEVELTSDLEAVATRIRHDLASVGERDGQVEVHLRGTEMPVYHRLARASAVPLWSRAPITPNPPNPPNNGRPAAATADPGIDPTS